MNRYGIYYAEEETDIPSHEDLLGVYEGKSKMCAYGKFMREKFPNMTEETVYECFEYTMYQIIQVK